MNQRNDTPVDRYRYTDGALHAHHFSVICKPLIPVLLKYQDEGKEEAIFKILDLLKDLYYSGNIHSINVVRRVKFQKLSKCDYNKKQVVYLNKILRNI